MRKITALAWAILLPSLLLVVFSVVIQTGKAATGSRVTTNGQRGGEQSGPPWFNGFEAWNYRRPLTISNVSVSANYPVLIRLDDSNFVFNPGADGSDVRFTDGVSTYTLSHWVEYWNSAEQLAYLWVKIPDLPVGDTTIYLYYDDPDATSTSDGAGTFDFFEDDWDQFSGVGCGVNPCPWTILHGNPVVQSGNLTLGYYTGITTVNPYLYKSVGYRANYGSGSGVELEWGGFINADGPRTYISYGFGEFDELYLHDYVTQDDLVSIGNTWFNSYHVYEVRWRNQQSYASIDHGALQPSTDPTQVPSAPLSVTFYNFLSDLGTTLKVDWVYVRQHQVTEPSVVVGTEQGRVDLGVTTVDSPDPLYPGEVLTYSLTVSNISEIDAAGVVLTDTLPGGFELASVDTSQGVCNNEIVCDLGLIPSNSTASITIFVTTTIDGIFSNTAVVGSPDYDPDLNNNIAIEETTVLPSADMSVEVQDIPDPILPETILTYLITVTNQGPSSADLVNVVATLPEELDYRSSSPDICYENGGVISCALGTIASGEETEFSLTAKVLLITTGTLEGSFSVGATTHDPVESNNDLTVETLVDADIPVVSWVSPVNEVDETYFTKGGVVTLEASASDNDQVGRVEFKYWDHLYDEDGDRKPDGRYVIIGEVTSAPYQAEFNCDVLEEGQLYQVFVKAFDRAGNATPIPLPRIFIRRLYPYNAFLPVIDK